MLLVIAGVIILGFGFMVFFGAPYVPSRRKYIRRIFEHVGVGPDDVLIDVGSGDGVVLRTASSYGARAIGYEINPVLVLVARLLSASDSRVSVRLTNFWRTLLPNDTTIVYAFSVSRDEAKLTKLLQREAERLKRPLKLICYASPLKSKKAEDMFDAYHIYTFRPLQSKKA